MCEGSEADSTAGVLQQVKRERQRISATLTANVGYYRRQRYPSALDYDPLYAVNKMDHSDLEPAHLEHDPSSTSA